MGNAQQMTLRVLYCVIRSAISLVSTSLRMQSPSAVASRVRHGVRTRRFVTRNIEKSFWIHLIIVRVSPEIALSHSFPRLLVMHRCVDFVISENKKRAYALRRIVS